MKFGFFILTQDYQGWKSSSRHHNEEGYPEEFRWFCYTMSYPPDGQGDSTQQISWNHTHVVSDPTGLPYLLEDYVWFIPSNGSAVLAGVDVSSTSLGREEISLSCTWGVRVGEVKGKCSGKAGWQRCMAGCSHTCADTNMEHLPFFKTTWATDCWVLTMFTSYNLQEYRAHSKLACPEL